jgi:hypothetical protein
MMELNPNEFDLILFRSFQIYVSINGQTITHNYTVAFKP